MLRFLRNAIVSLAALLVFGCATAPLPKFEYERSARIVIVNLIESELTHTYIGFTRFQNHRIPYPVDWDIPGRIITRLTKQLGERAIVVDPPSWLLDAEGDLIVAGWDTFYLDEKFESGVSRFCREEEADAVMILRSYGAVRWMVSAERYVRGWGIYSRTAIGNNPALVYTNLTAQVLNCDPPTLTLTAEASDIHVLPTYIEPEDSKQLPASEIDKARPLVEVNVDSMVDEIVSKINLQTR